MSDVINTESYLFKMYADRRIRKSGIPNIEGVIQCDASTVNICNYGRNIVLQMLFRCMINLGKFVGGIVLGMFIITPIMSIGLWLFTDNPFWPFFGNLGEIILVIEAFLLCMVAAAFAIAAVEQTDVLQSTARGVRKMTMKTTIAQWFKAKHGKFCLKLQFDRKSDYDHDDDDTTATERKRKDNGMEWPDEHWDRE